VGGVVVHGRRVVVVREGGRGGVAVIIREWGGRRHVSGRLPFVGG
jgi:hypothetical protein